MGTNYDHSAFEPTDNPLQDWQDNPDPQQIVKTQPKVANDLSGLIGKHIIYTYANGWQYEFYFRNDHCGDYRINGGVMKGRWTNVQRYMPVNLGNGLHKVAWIEPTGSIVSLDINFDERWLHGFFGLAQWLMQSPEVGTVHQNEHLKNIREHRDKGPLYPQFVSFDFAEITYLEDRGADNDEVINCEVDQLPDGYWDRRN